MALYTQRPRQLLMGEYYRCHGAEGWVLKCDIHHYFDSIDQSDVLRRAERYVPDAMLFSQLYFLPCGYWVVIVVARPEF